jgi:hypothetical protein
MDSRVPAAPIFSAFGVPAVLTRPDEAPIDTTAVWMPEDAQNTRWGAPDETGVEILRVVPATVISFLAAEVVAVPVGSLVVAAEELGGDALQWRVTEIVRVESDLITVIVHPLRSAEYLAGWGKT